MNTPTRYTTLISVDQLRALQASGARLRIFDTSFDLMNPGAGAQQYDEAHIPGALYAHLDRDLSAKSGGVAGAATDVGTASGGRHPLPTRERFAQWLGAMGVDAGTQVVVYDRQGVNYCGRLWWMVQWCGHAAVAVLDGGWQAWQAAGLPAATGAEEAPAARPFALGAANVPLVDTARVSAQLGHATQTLIDARAPARYRGETEPLDPIAGHIPGALNRPFANNFDASGRFKPAEQLRQEFDTLLSGRDPATVVHHCGSGVSAVPNVLAMCIAGWAPTGLYAGSWSEWCSDAHRPVAQG